MADSFARGESSHQGMPEPLRSSQFPEIASTTTQVVLVMDGPKEFTIKPLKWALENISASGGIKVPLLGAMPWINIPRQYLVFLCVCVCVYLYAYFVLLQIVYIIDEIV